MIKAMIAGYEKFKREPFVDATKMGIFGYSRGAMAAALMATKGFASKVLLIHTGLQPGGKALTLLRNRFNGFLSEVGKTVETVSC